jgi:hypothetical protein
MNCPKCGYFQRCPCSSCESRNTMPEKPWVWLTGETISCAGCGFTESANWWADKEMDQYIKEVRKKKKEENK